MNIDKKLDELFNLLDNDFDIKKITELKNKITNTELELISNYRNNPTVSNKKKLYENETIRKYLECENNINYLIMMINSKLKRRHDCASNKW